MGFPPHTTLPNTVRKKLKPMGFPPHTPSKHCQKNTLSDRISSTHPFEALLENAVNRGDSSTSPFQALLEKNKEEHGHAQL